MKKTLSIIEIIFVLISIWFCYMAASTLKQPIYSIYADKSVDFMILSAFASLVCSFIVSIIKKHYE